MEEKLLKIITDYTSKKKSKNMSVNDAKKLISNLLSYVEFDKNKVKNNLNELPEDQ